MKASCSMLSQILKLIPRADFERLVKKTKAEHRSKGLSSWSQFVGMLFCQLGQAHCLREIEGGLKSCEGKLAHLGIEASARSSLSYANAHRPWELFDEVFYNLYGVVAAKAAGKKRFCFRNKLISLDPTVIDLCLSMHDWAKFRRTKGAAKLHLVLDSTTMAICRALVSSPTARCMMSKPPIRLPLCRAPSLSMTGGTTITGCSPTGQTAVCSSSPA